jgi:hypothetical protein
MKTKYNKIITNIKETIIVIIGILILAIIVGYLADWMEQGARLRDLDCIIQTGTDLILKKLKGPARIGYISEYINIINTLSKENNLNATEELKVLIGIKKNLSEYLYRNQTFNGFENSKLKFLLYELNYYIEDKKVEYINKIINSI